MPDIARPLGEGVLRMPEVAPTPELIEHKQESIVEKEVQKTEKPPVQETVAVPVVASQPTTTALATTTKAPLRRDIEKILEEDLRFLYLELPPERQVIFRQQGDLTASRIEYLMTHAKLQIDYLVYLIRRWLMIVPGINRYFLEQESKIKAEKILFLNTKE